MDQELAPDHAASKWWARIEPVLSTMASGLGFREPEVSQQGRAPAHESVSSVTTSSLPSLPAAPAASASSIWQPLCSSPQGEQLHQGLSSAGRRAVGDPAAGGGAVPGGPLRAPPRPPAAHW